MQLEFEENQAVVWVMESPQLFRKYGQELMTQADGGEGGFILSDGDNILDIKHNLEVILTPYSLDLNDRKCLNRMYAELKDLAYSEQHYVETQSVLGQIQKYLITLEQDARIDLSYTEPDFVQLLKVFGTGIGDIEQDMLSKTAQYLKVAAILLNKKVLVFVNLSFYLEKKEIEELLKEAFYLKMFVILIESHEIDFSVASKRYIIDKDNCEIY